MGRGRPIKDRSGEVHGHWTLLERLGTRGTATIYKCRCKCGAERIQPVGNIVAGRSVSCGCRGVGRPRSPVDIHIPGLPSGINAFEYGGTLYYAIFGKSDLDPNYRPQLAKFTRREEAEAWLRENPQ